MQDATANYVRRRSMSRCLGDQLVGGQRSHGKMSGTLAAKRAAVIWWRSSVVLRRNMHCVRTYKM